MGRSQQMKAANATEAVLTKKKIRRKPGYHAKREIKREQKLSEKKTTATAGIRRMVLSAVRNCAEGKNLRISSKAVDALQVWVEQEGFALQRLANDLTIFARKTTVTPEACRFAAKLMNCKDLHSISDSVLMSPPVWTPSPQERKVEHEKPAPEQSAPRTKASEMQKAVAMKKQIEDDEKAAKKAAKKAKKEAKRAALEKAEAEMTD